MSNNTSNMESVKISWTGQAEDILVYSNGYKEALPLQHNLVVNGAREAIAGTLGGLVTGIQQHAVGRGDPNWDTNLQNPSVTDTSLFDEIIRKVPTTTFINEITGTADSGSDTTLVDDALTTFTDDEFKDLTLHITDGTNSGESRVITGFSSGSGTVTVGDAFTNPIDNTSVYEINLPTTSRTNKIESEITLTPLDITTEENLREQGLFGVDATTAKDSGVMINNIRHSAIVKDGSVELIRRIRIKVLLA